MKTYLDKTVVPVDSMLFEASLAAMQGLLSTRSSANSPEYIAMRAVECAKALIKELSVKGSNELKEPAEDMD